MEEEFVIHVLQSCPAAQDVWGCGLVTLRESFVQVFESLANYFKKEDLELMAVMAWGIWFRRNKMVFEDEFLHPN
jgi:hypothetical protein